MQGHRGHGEALGLGCCPASPQSRLIPWTSPIADARTLSANLQTGDAPPCPPQPLPPSLGPALALHGRPYGVRQRQGGVMEAPVGDATIVFTNVVGISTLMAWDVVGCRWWGGDAGHACNTTSTVVVHRIGDTGLVMVTNSVR